MKTEQTNQTPTLGGIPIKTIRREFTLSFNGETLDGSIEVPTHPDSEVWQEIGRVLVRREVCPEKGWDQNDFKAQAKFTWK